MFIERPAAEIEPSLAMRSSNATLPGPRRPSWSKSIRMLRRGIVLRSSLSVPLRRAAGERVGPIAKQWEGEVVFRRSEMLPLADTAAHLTLPAQARVPSLSSRDDAGGEGL